MWNGDFFKISQKLVLKFLKVSSKLGGHPEIWGSDIQPQLRQRFYQWLAGGLSIWRLCRVVCWNVATSMSVRSGRSWGKCLKVFLWSFFNQLPCRKVCYPAIRCNSCWDHSCNTRCAVFRTYCHLIQGHCATCEHQLVLVSVTRPGSNLLLPLLISVSCTSQTFGVSL